MVFTRLYEHGLSLLSDFVFLFAEMQVAKLHGRCKMEIKSVFGNFDYQQVCWDVNIANSKYNANYNSKYL